MSQAAELSEPAASAQDLRAALEQMRREAEREITRLNSKLADREHATETRMVSATESVALKQELTTLRRALGQKEQALDRITEECRRLEDQLEDQHRVFDDLRQDAERREDSLQEARQEALRLRQQLAAIQDQSMDLSGPASRALERPLDTATHQVTTAQGGRAGASPSIRGFAVGVLAALAVAGALWMSTGGGLPWSRDRHPEPVAQPSEAEDPPQDAAQAEDAGSASVDAAPDEAPTPPLSRTGTPPEPPPTVRDQLRGGAAGPSLSMLPAGTFRMGRNTLSGNDTGPERDVQVGAFWMGIQEVTYAQYDRFARATGRRLPGDFGWGRGDRPVVGVSWGDAQAYVDWLSSQTGRRYRLPSEAEWEYAAKSGGRGSYWWGFGLESGRAACFDCGSPWDNKSTAPVGSFPPSPYGLHDTAGNVMEWVADCYHPSYEGAPADGRARADGDCRLRIARGGAFNKPSASMRTYVRTKLDPNSRLNNLGFRVARDP